MNLHRYLLILLLVAGGMTAQAETWTTLNGQTFDAEFRGMWGKAAIFERSDGKRAAITLLNMNAESRIRLQKLNEVVTARRQERIDQLKQQVPAGTAMEAAGEGALFGGEAGTKTLPPEVAYETLAEAMDLEATVKHLIRQSASGHMRIFWDALPPSYQRDLDQLRVELTGKVPADRWDARIEVLSKAVRILQEKEEMIFGISMLATMPAETKTSIQQGIAPIVGQLATIVKDDRLSHASVSQTELGSLIAAVSTDISGQLRRLLESAPSQAGGLPDVEQVQIATDSDDRGTVTDPSSGETTNWMRVEERWISENFAGDWAGNLQKARTAMESMFDEESDATVAQVQTVLDDLLAAEDQQAFESVVLRVMLQLGPLMQQFGPPDADLGGF